MTYNCVYAIKPKQAKRYPSLLLLPGQLWPAVVVAVSCPFICEMNLFEDPMYQIRIFVTMELWKLFVLARNTYDHIDF